MEIGKIIVHPENCVRCYRCELECSFSKTRVFNPEEAFIKIDWDWLNDEPRISFTDDCDGCGLCAKSCIYGALTLKDAG